MSFQKTNYLEKELHLLLGWIAAAETKIPNVLVLATSMLGVNAALGGLVKSWSIWSIAVPTAAAALLAACIMFAAMASFPRTTGPANSLIFFGRIASRNLNQYIHDVSSMDEAMYVSDLAAQCHRNAEIAAAKHKNVRWSLMALFVASPIWAWSVYLMFRHVR